MSHAEAKIAHERPTAKVTHPDHEETQRNKRHEGEVNQQHQIRQNRINIRARLHDPWDRS